MPRLRHIANLWTLWEHPTEQAEWSLQQKLSAIAAAGFDGVCWAPSDELTAGCAQFGLEFVGGIAGGAPETLPAELATMHRSGAVHVNVQLGTDALAAADALQWTLQLMQAAHANGILPAIETHRGTCTETPEKMYELADAYYAATGQLLSISFDFSHYAVVKHLLPEEFEQRLLVRPELVQHAAQFHMRPFNGHHVQVPITQPDGALTPEVMAWAPFATAVFRTWLRDEKNSDRDIYVCPELGPKRGGYALSSFPGSWTDSVRLRALIDELWLRALSEEGRARR